MPRHHRSGLLPAAASRSAAAASRSAADCVGDEPPNGEPRLDGGGGEPSSKDRSGERGDESAPSCGEPRSDGDPVPRPSIGFEVALAPLLLLLLLLLCVVLPRKRAWSSGCCSRGKSP
eukprot:SAG22_NODE_436_length_10519_cov_21.912188_6_plen_118_part_00